jgi:hypothetical protein
MAYENAFPEWMPEPGFYYHYKHDPAGPFNNYSYEVIGTALHTEDRTKLVAYRPLYENTYLAELDFSVRPLDMFMGTVEKDGKAVPRFEMIKDPAVIAELTDIRDRMYGN